MVFNLCNIMLHRHLAHIPLAIPSVDQQTIRLQGFVLSACGFHKQAAPVTPIGNPVISWSPLYSDTWAFAKAQLI